MNRSYLTTILAAIIVTITTWQNVNAQQLRAVMPFGGLLGDNPNHCFSEQAVRVYQQLGYNTIFAYIEPPVDPSDWNLPEYTLKPTKKQELVNEIRRQKRFINDLGINYCPYFNEWGHGNLLPRINPRVIADVYREPAVFGGGIYYNQNIYSHLAKEADPGWGDFNHEWNDEHTVLRFEYSGSGEECGRCIFRTMNYTDSSISSIPDKLINGQCYEITYSIDLSNANLAIGDKIRIYYFRQYAEGYRPDSSIIPLGKLERQNTNDREVFEKNYKVTSVTPYQFDKGTVDPNTNILVLKDTIWIEEKLEVPTGNYLFNDYFRLDFILITNGTNDDKVMTMTINSLKPLNPRNIVSNDLWETSPHYPYYRDNADYPYERLRETKGVYQVGDLIVENSLYHDEPPAGGNLIKVKGHFPRWNNDLGKGEHNVIAVDPLSPVTDLVTKEMLRVIREGLDNTEPAYFFIASDEVNVFRRSILNCKGGPAETPYNSLSNLEYWSKIVRDHIERYKLIFKGSKSSEAKTTFMVYGDMVLPFASGYHIYAESNSDNDGMEYLASTKGNDKISVAIWVYDYMDFPTHPGDTNRQFMLKDYEFMNKTIKMVTDNDLNYIAFYATDGTINEFNNVAPGLIKNDEANIQHEIDLARNWCNITTNNSKGFTGYCYSGWSDYFQANRWNGLYSLAYFGWIDRNADDFQDEWKTFISPGGDNGEPVLLMTRDLQVPQEWYSQGAVFCNSYEEALHENNLSKPRIEIFNDNNNPISDFTVHYYFTVDQGKTPVLEDYWTPDFSIRLNQIENSLWEIQFRYTGAPLQSNNRTPQNSGTVVGLHYSDWSAWDKTKDYSFYNTSVFRQNSRIVITDNSGNVLSGYRP